MVANLLTRKRSVFLPQVGFQLFVLLTVAHVFTSAGSIHTVPGFLIAAFSLLHRPETVRRPPRFLARLQYHKLAD